MLGVVLRPSGFALMGTGAETLRKYTSEWGVDPLWHSAEMAPVLEADFANAVASKTGLRLAELDNPDVGIVGFKPDFDKEGQRWFADIEMRPGQAYFPFVRLAVARFQPESIAGVHLSSTVLTDFVQIVPERTATYDLANVVAGGEVEVALEGPGHDEGDWARNGRTIVVARLEARAHGDTSTTEPLGWTAIDSVLLERAQGPSNTVRWIGSVDLPTPLPKRLRVSILEAQLLRADGGRVAEFIRQLSTGREERGAALGMHSATIAGPGETFGARVVFADETVIVS
jgi:choline dehydrogenase-like flavoprotein